MRILLIEDERKLADYVRKGLTEQNYVVDIARDGIDGRHAALEGDYDVVVLDVMLPGVDGFGVLSELRKPFDTNVLDQRALRLTAPGDTDSTVPR